MSKKFKEIMPSLIAVLIALLIGGIIMISKGVNPIFAYADMAKSAFYQTSPRSPFMSGLARTLLTATPLIFSALAAMVAFKAGLFNIGAQGQMIAGGLAATFWAVTFRNYVIGNLLIVLIVAMIAGFLFLGVAYGIYMKALGFGFLYPTLMALLIYAGSVEFIAARALIAPFSPISVLLITLMISTRQIFYGISMLEKYGIHIGYKRWYLITTLVDESFSLNYMAKIPPHLDKGWYMFFVSLYLHIYWVVGAAIGNLFGSVLPFDLKGVEFSMTALFLVIFAENWIKEKSHESSLLGLGIALAFLLIVGKEYFLIPTLIGIWLILTMRGPKLETKLESLK